VEDAIPPLPEDISDDLNDFLRLCFIKDPNSRPEAKVMSEHPWVKKMNPEIVCIGFSGANISWLVGRLCDPGTAYRSSAASAWTLDASTAALSSLLKILVLALLA
jgi:serine/threonine protein kinase